MPDPRILNAIEDLQEKIYINALANYNRCHQYVYGRSAKIKISRDTTPLTEAESFYMACQALQVEYQGKEAAAMFNCQLLLTEIKDLLIAEKSKFPI